MSIALLWPGQDIPPSTSTNPVRRRRYEQAADILRRTDGYRWNWAPARTARHLIEALDSVDEWEARALAAEARTARARFSTPPRQTLTCLHCGWQTPSYPVGDTEAQAACEQDARAHERDCAEAPLLRQMQDLEAQLEATENYATAQNARLRQMEVTTAAEKTRQDAINRILDEKVSRLEEENATLRLRVRVLEETGQNQALANDVERWRLEASRDAEALARLTAVLRDIRDNWDCDEDGHRYGTGCRSCDAAEILSTMAEQDEETER